MYRFLIDHNVPRKVGIFLRKQKFNVRFVQEINPEMSDIEVIKLASKENRIIISNDKDFMSLSFLYPDVNMILFSLISQASEIRIKSLEKILPSLNDKFGVLVIK